MKGKLVRCFIAVDIDNQDITSRIVNFQKELISNGLRAKIVESENLHITLRFIGEIPPILVDSIRRELKNVNFNTFSIYLKGVGGFPSLLRPRVIWIGVAEGAEELINLNHSINGVLSKLRLPSRKERFHPHLTIARVKAPLNNRTRLILEKSKDLEFGRMIVKDFKFMRSQLTPSGPIYTVIEKYSAKNGGDT